jgi:hypothetical protein
MVAGLGLLHVRPAAVCNVQANAVQYVTWVLKVTWVPPPDIKQAEVMYPMLWPVEWKRIA